MIAHPAGWSVAILDDAEVLVAPEGAAAGAIRYCERLAPVRPVPVLLAQQLADDPELAVDEVGPVRELVTAEGEHAALVRLSGRLHGERIQRDIGYVLGDDVYARIGGVVRRPALFERSSEIVASLVRGCSLMLGVRQRRFRSLAPAGWTRHDVGRRAEWTAPGFPDDPGALTVWPALPLVLGGATFAAGFGRGGAGPYPVRSRHGLGGQRWERVVPLAGGGHLTRELAVFTDERYAYPLRIEYQDPAHGELFRKILASAEPVPAPRGASATAARVELLSMWS
jgi:hypothetical protein